MCGEYPSRGPITNGSLAVETKVSSIGAKLHNPRIPVVFTAVCLKNVRRSSGVEKFFMFLKFGFIGWTRSEHVTVHAISEVKE